LNIPRFFRLAASLVLLVYPGTVAQAVDPQLEFFGFRAGASLAELDRHLGELGGGRLRCDRAKADPRVRECRAVLNDPDLGGSVDLWVSAIDSMAGIITVSGTVASEQLDHWRRRLETGYGRVGAQVQGTQWMMQWVRQGRMLRLTWRIDQGQKLASVSLIDGHILDAWGQSRSSKSPSKDLPKAP
jgi:hypothetical protein